MSLLVTLYIFQTFLKYFFSNFSKFQTYLKHISNFSDSIVDFEQVNKCLLGPFLTLVLGMMICCFFFAFLWHTINTLSILTWLVAIIYETLYY